MNPKGVAMNEKLDITIIVAGQDRQPAAYTVPFPTDPGAAERHFGYLCPILVNLLRATQSVS